MEFDPIRKIFAAGIAFICVQKPCHAVDAASFEFATGNRTQIARIGAQWDWRDPLWHSDTLRLGGYWELTGAQWYENRFRNVPGNTRDIQDFAITPVYRLQNNARSGPYVEAGVGIHYLSEGYDNNRRQLSTNFQFGSHVGVGYVLDSKFDVGMKIRHISNGGIRKPNDGINFVAVCISYRF